MKEGCLGLTLVKAERLFSEWKEPSYRAKQLLGWIFKHEVLDVGKMLNLSVSLREKLKEHLVTSLPKWQRVHTSSDGTQRFLMLLADGNAVETVYIPDGKRGTLCISSQVGCALDCSFCATGKEGFNRNLSAHEIVAQLYLAKRSLGEENPLTNVVFMGMGEPMLNIEAVLDAVTVMTADWGYGLSRRRVTVSTSGVYEPMIRFADASDASLAVSLHAPFDDLRESIMPVNRACPIDKLMEACRYYIDKGSQSRHIFFEYVMLKGINDHPSHAAALAKLLRGMPCKVNLIPFNPFSGCDHETSSDDAIEAFREVLQQKGIRTLLRRTRGEDVSAACGQLVGDFHDKTSRRKSVALTL